jgi:superfamily II DNA/RNA helicase
VLIRVYFSPRNMIGQSQSGTGKTAAFVLTMLSRLNLGLHVPQVCIYTNIAGKTILKVIVGY